MKTETQLFTISDLAARKVSAFYNPQKHDAKQLNKILSAAFPADVLGSSGVNRMWYYLSTEIKPGGRWTCNQHKPDGIPSQSLELFEL